MPERLTDKQELMTAVLRLHHLMTASVDRTLGAEAGISLTEYQILAALQRSETGTWLLSAMARHLMMHATTVTLSVERLEAKQLVHRVSHPSDRRATLIAITEDGRGQAARATAALTTIDFGLPGLSPSQARSMISAIAAVLTDRVTMR